MTIRCQRTLDQAMRLRQRVAAAARVTPAVHPHGPDTIAVSGGKGGVGKSNISLNLAHCLAGRGHRVMLVDTDFGLSNLDVLLGVSPRFDLGDVIAGRCDPADALTTLPSGISLLVGGISPTGTRRHRIECGRYSGPSPPRWPKWIA